jgi:cold-inducible RNA-binding protein
MSKKLFIGNCNFNLDETALQSFIESNGIQVTSVQIIRDRDTGRSRGFGFAELEESQDMGSAIEALNGKELDGRPLTVNEAREQRPRGGGGGRGGGGFRGGSGGGGGRRNRW